MVDFLAWVILGFIAGVLAKFIMPGKDPGGCLITILLGVGGAFIGGYLGNQLGIGGQVGGLSVASIVTATAGALVLLLIYRLIYGKGK